MKQARFLISGLLPCVLLAACSAKQELKYSMTVNVDEPALVMNLINASERVYKRRMAALGVENAVVTAVPAGGSGGVLTIQVPDAAVSGRMKQILAEPFTFAMKIELKETTMADQNMAENWQSTGIENRHITRLQAVTDAKAGEVGVEITFTPEGRELLDAMLRANKGKTLGIFVRDVLASKISIDGGAAKDHIVISGIPSATVAQIFADDVNVGLHVAFTPAGN